MTKKRVLIISAFYPSYLGAGVKYTLNLINDLENDFIVDTYYFSSLRTIMEDRKFIGIKSNFILKLIRSLLFPIIHPFFASRFSLYWVLKFNKLKRKYDIIYFDFSQVSIYSLFINHPQKYIMLHDIIKQKYARKQSGALSKISNAWISYSEKLILKYSKSNLLTFSSKDSNLLKKYYSLDSQNIDFYISGKIRNISNISVEDYFVFMGVWSRPENYESLQWFFEYVYSNVKKDTKIIIIGSDLSPNFLKLIQKLDNVKYLGFVDNPYPIIAKSKALLAPIFQGAGVKVKCLETILCGAPVIGTTVAFEGIDNKLLKHCIVANSVNDFINAIKIVDIQEYDRIKWHDLVNDFYPIKSFKKIISETE